MAGCFSNEQKLISEVIKLPDKASKNFLGLSFDSYRKKIVPTKAELESILSGDDLRLMLDHPNNIFLPLDLRDLIKTGDQVTTAVKMILKAASYDCDDSDLKHLSTLCIRGFRMVKDSAGNKLLVVLMKDILETFTKLIKQGNTIVWIPKDFKGPGVNNDYEEQFTSLKYIAYRYVRFLHCLAREDAIDSENTTLTQVMLIVSQVSNMKQNKICFELVNELLKCFKEDLKMSVSSKPLLYKEEGRTILNGLTYLARKVHLSAESRSILREIIDYEGKPCDFKQYQSYQWNGGEFKSNTLTSKTTNSSTQTYKTTTKYPKPNERLLPFFAQSLS